MKQQLFATQPIGIFDSGIGGLTVADAVTKYLPNEDIVYFGDTAHLPYGDKSTSAIQAYAVKIVHMLLQQECKLILIACHSASVASYHLIKEYVGSKALVVNMVDPVVALLQKDYVGKKVGLIGTKQTVNSQAYKKRIDDIDLDIDLSCVTTNLLASAIEEFGDHKVLDTLLEVYLADVGLQNIDALILACTHYPLIKRNIAAYYNNNIDIIDSSDIAAQAVKKQLAQHELLNTTGHGNKSFYISDYTASFASKAKLFFGENIVLESYPLWD